MRTYIIAAPPGDAIGNDPDDFGVVFAEDAELARDSGAIRWDCSPDAIRVLFNLPGELAIYPGDQESRPIQLREETDATNPS